MEPKQNTDPNRREFLSRAGKAGISAAAAAGLFGSLYDSRGPRRGVESRTVENLGDFSAVAQNQPMMSIVEGTERDNMLTKAIELLGGIKRFVKPGETVMIKPNVAFQSPPILGATTHPDLVKRMVELCFEAGAGRVIVTDNPINDAASCFTITGIRQAAEKAGAEVIIPREGLFSNISLKGAELIRNWPVYNKPVNQADKLIGITPLKDHHRSGASMTMKNWYGLLGGRRNIFHQNINTIIAELSMLVKPTLVVLDGTKVMMTNGPTGGSLSDLRNGNTLIAGCDMVAVDAFGAGLLDLKPSDLPYLAKAQRAGTGTTDYESLKPNRASIQ